MGLTLSNSGGDFQSAPEGTHPAVIYRVIDLGTQQVAWQGETKWQHKVLLAFELHGDERMADGRPFVISKRYTASFSDKAKIRQHLEAIRGRAFTPEELAGFHLRNVLGAPCLLQVVHETKGESTYANIGALMRLPKSMPKPTAENELLYFDLDDPDLDIFSKFSERLQEIIRATPEWAEKVDGKTAPPAAARTRVADKALEDEEIPF